jgi:hypothetical protein
LLRYTLAAFRQQHLQALADLFMQALRQRLKAGLGKLGNVSIDGVKIKADANAWRSMNYLKLSKREQHWRAELACRRGRHSRRTVKKINARAQPNREPGRPHAFVEPAPKNAQT